MKIIYLAIVLCASLVPSALTAKCEFFMDRLQRYSCRLIDGTFLNPNDPFPIEAIHDEGMSDDDVRMIVAVNSTLNFVPLQIFDKFRQIRAFDLWRVSLTELHQPWRNCEHLTDVWLQNNQIKRLPARIFEPCGLITSLSLRNTGIEEIDVAAFMGLSYVRRLDLSFNQLKYLDPEILQPMIRLNTFLFEWMGLERLHPHTFRDFSYARGIFLSGNNFTAIESGTFLNLPMLQMILLNGNSQLTDLQPFAFGALDSLRYLDFSDANLTELRSSSFSRLPQVDTFFMRWNRVGKIERNFFQNFPELFIFDATANICVNGSFWRASWQYDEIFLKNFEKCFWRFEGSPITTTLGASGMTLSIALVVSLLIIKMIF